MPINNKLNKYIFCDLKTRLFARTIDILYIITISTIISGLSLYYRHSNLFPYKSTFPFYLFLLFFCWIWILRIDLLYNIFLLSSKRSATYGMYQNNIKIINKNGEKISILRAFIRYILYALPIELVVKTLQELTLDNLGFNSKIIFLFLIMCISPLLMIFHPQNRTYYDILCGTYLVYDDEHKT